jgi:hypothetical protein
MIVENIMDIMNKEAVFFERKLAVQQKIPCFIRYPAGAALTEG